MWTLSATAYSAKSTDLPTAVKVSLTSTLKAAFPLETTTTLTYGTRADVVFANAVELSENPLGIDLAGEVSVLGADKDEVQPKGDILIGGEPIDFELVDIDEDGVIEGPLVVVMRVYSNGKGTRGVTTVSSGKPGLL